MAARYEALIELASGGMATVWIGTARGALGFRQLVALKKPHPHLLDEAGFRDELIAEARLASLIHHANVVDVRDVEMDGASFSLVMDYIEGASLGDLLVAASKRPETSGESTRIPPRVAVRILRDACAGLHAAHELVDEKGRPVGLVHRDISPQNILVGKDGIARVADFGVAKFARKNMPSTGSYAAADGVPAKTVLKGKLAYMGPEYLRGEPIDRRCDVFGAGVVLWEALTGKRCFRGDGEADTYRRVLEVTPPRVSSVVPELAPLDNVVAAALEKSPAKRFQNAAAMGAALECAATEAGLFGSHTEVATTLEELFGAVLNDRRKQVRAKLAHEPSLQSMGADVVMSPVPADVVAANAMATDAVAADTVAEAVAGGADAKPGPATPHATAREPAAEPLTERTYEVESTRSPARPTSVRRIFVYAVGGAASLAMAIAIGTTLGQASSDAPATQPGATATATATATANPNPTPTANASANQAAPTDPNENPNANPTPTASAASAPPSATSSPTATIARGAGLAPAPRPVMSTVPSAKRPPANPYE